MAFHEDGLLSAEANTDLSSSQHRFVKLVAGGKVELAGAGEQILGVLMNKPTAGQPALVQAAAGATAKLEVDGTAGGGIAAGTYLLADANGKGVESTTNLDKVGAIAREASAADGDIISVLVLAPGTERSV